MSGTIGAANYAGYGTMSTLIANAATVRQKLDQLTTQASTGLIGQTYAGLGATGNLSAPYAPPATLGDLAAALVGAQAADSAATTSRLATETGVQTTLQGQLTSQSGVNMDAQMSQMIALQNAYGANAKVMAAVQAMFTQLLGSIQ